ncbi:unnamed protein product, partial [Nesidiocoris tenuis]
GRGIHGGRAHGRIQRPRIQFHIRPREGTPSAFLPTHSAVNSNTANWKVDSCGV